MQGLRTTSSDSLASLTRYPILRAGLPCSGRTLQPALFLRGPWPEGLGLHWPDPLDERTLVE